MEAKSYGRNLIPGQKNEIFGVFDADVINFEQPIFGHLTTTNTTLRSKNPNGIITESHIHTRIKQKATEPVVFNLVFNLHHMVLTITLQDPCCKDIRITINLMSLRKLIGFKGLIQLKIYGVSCFVLIEFMIYSSQRHYY